MSNGEWRNLGKYMRMTLVCIQVTNVIKLIEGLSETDCTWGTRENQRRFGSGHKIVTKLQFTHDLAYEINQKFCVVRQGGLGNRDQIVAIRVGMWRRYVQITLQKCDIVSVSLAANQNSGYSWIGQTNILEISLTTSYSATGAAIWLVYTKMTWKWTGG